MPITTLGRSLGRDHDVQFVDIFRLFEGFTTFNCVFGTFGYQDAEIQCWLALMPCFCMFSRLRLQL